MQKNKIIISRDEIQRRVRELGKQITADYTDRRLVVIGILNGAFMFVADLVREIDLPLEIDFIRVASYGSKTSSAETISFTKDIELPINDKDILLVEDIVDTGKTAGFLEKIFKERSPRSVRLCALIDKEERRETPVRLDYTGFKVKRGFLAGYGLDYAEQHRQRPDIFQLEEDPFTSDT